MTARLRLFPAMRDGHCTACGRPDHAHRVAGVWVTCVHDIAGVQDCHALERLRRLAAIQARRGVRVRPFGIE